MLPNVERQEDIEALSNALEEVFKPVLGEILETIKNVRASFPNKSDAEFLKNAIQYSMDALQESVDKMTKGKTAPKDENQILTLVAGLKDADEKFREEIVAELLSNKQMQTAVLGGVNREILDAMNEHLAELVGAADAEKKLREDEKKRADQESRDKNRDKANTKARTQAKEPGVVSKALNIVPDVLEGLVKSFRNIGLALGAFGLFSMLPKQIQDTVVTFTTTFTYIRELMKSGFLAPVLKLLESLPVLGTLIKKLPMLNMIMAAFEIIPKIVAAFNKDGIWAAVQTGLKAVYDFFVGDVLDLVAKFGDWVQEKLFGDVFVDLTDGVAVFSASIHKWVDNVAAIFKSLFTGDLKGALSNFGKAVFDGIDGLVNTVLTLFKLPANWNTKEKVAELLGAVSAAYESAKAWVVESVKGIGQFVSDGVAYLLTAITDKWNAAIQGIGNFGEGIANIVNVAGQFATDLWTSFTTKISDTWNAGVSTVSDVGDYLTGLFDSVKNWIVDSWNAGIAGIKDFGTSVSDAISGIWNAITDKIVSVFTDAVSGLKDLKDEISAWFSNMVKKTVNAIIDQLPSWMGTDSLKFDIEELTQKPKADAPEAKKPMAQSEKTLLGKTLAVETARMKNQRTRGGVSATVNNKNVSSQTTFAIKGSIDAFPVDPLGRR